MRSRPFSFKDDRFSPPGDTGHIMKHSPPHCSDLSSVQRRLLQCVFYTEDLTTAVYGQLFYNVFWPATPSHPETSLRLSEPAQGGDTDCNSWRHQLLQWCWHCCKFLRNSVIPIGIRIISDYHIKVWSKEVNEWLSFDHFHNDLLSPRISAVKKNRSPFKDSGY